MTKPPDITSQRESDALRLMLGVLTGMAETRPSPRILAMVREFCDVLDDEFPLRPVDRTNTARTRQIIDRIERRTPSRQ